MKCSFRAGASCALLLSSMFTMSAQADSAADVAARTQAAIQRGEMPEWWSPNLPPEVQKDVDSKGQRLAAQLKLEDEAKTKNAASLITQHFTRLWAWNQNAEARLNDAWAAWDQARDNSNGKEKDELKALTVMSEQIDPIYAEFSPQIQGFLFDMQNAVGEEKTNEFLDAISRSPGAKRTYDAYVAMVPEMTDAEKAVLWNRMAQARQDSLAAWSDKQIIKIFKKYKIRNEFSIDYFGYGYRERYQAWANKGK